MKFKIYQLNKDVSDFLRFARFDTEEKVQPENYDLVYEGELETNAPTEMVLNHLLDAFNVAIPKDFYGHSMSVSDVICLQKGAIQEYFYVDSVGFVKLNMFGEKTITGIQWDTDGEDVELPETVSVDPEINDEEIPDILSDTYEYCVFGYTVVARQRKKREPKFIAYVKMLDALAKEGMVARDPNNRNNLLVYRERVKMEDGSFVSGWFTENIFEVAQELFMSEEDRNSLFSVVRERGKTVVFSDSGDFVELRHEK